VEVMQKVGFSSNQCASAVADNKIIRRINLPRLTSLVNGAVQSGWQTPVGASVQVQGLPRLRQASKQYQTLFSSNVWNIFDLNNFICVQ
jgi:hypothetical protein